MNRDRARIVVGAAALVAAALLLWVFLRSTTAYRPGPAPAPWALAAAGVQTVALSGGRTLDFYFDPGRSGPNGLHVTFFDARGQGLDVARATITATGPAGRPAPLPLLQEGPGHFYSDGDFEPGRWTLDVVATTPAAEVLRARLAVRF
jgi:hypothetical protein